METAESGPLIVVNLKKQRGRTTIIIKTSPKERRGEYAFD